LFEALKTNSHFIYIEILFFGCYFLFAIFCSFHPEIFWGEKPMDFTFYNYFTRLEKLPPDEPWAAGLSLNYYYFGYFLWGLFNKIIHIPTSYGYNLALATLAALSAVGIYSFFSFFKLSKKMLIVLALGFLLLSNLEVSRLVLSGKNWDFNLFWASTRHLAYPSFAEYPFWSFLFGDLHPHVMGYPIVILLLTLLCSLNFYGFKKRNKSFWMTIFFLGWGLGILIPLNIWDFFSAALLISIFYLMTFFKKIFKETKKSFKTNLFLSFCIIFCLAYALFLPFHLKLEIQNHLYFGVQRSGFNQLYQIFFHYGHWMIFLIFPFLKSMQLIFFKRKKIRSLIWVPHLIIYSIVLFLPILFGLILYFEKIQQVPWGILLTSSLALLLFTPFYIRYSEGTRPFYFLVLIIFVFLGLGFVECFTLIDRMNTIFKFYNFFNIIFAMLGGLSLIFISKIQWRRSKWNKLILCIVAFSLFGSAVNSSIMIRHRRVEGHRPTLDGLAYLDNWRPDEAKLVTWIQKNIKGTPTILEAHGPSYQTFTRMSMYTGLPTLLGWDYHVSQRGVSKLEIKNRKKDLKTIYSTTDVQEAYALLRKYRVRYLVIGVEELRSFSTAGLSKFTHSPQYFQKVFHSNETMLYKVIYKPNEHQL